jgi:hypothetical protein
VPVARLRSAGSGKHFVYFQHHHVVRPLIEVFRQRRKLAAIFAGRCFVKQTAQAEKVGLCSPRAFRRNEAFRANEGMSFVRSCHQPNVCEFRLAAKEDDV